MFKFMMLAMALGCRLQDEDPNGGGGTGGAADPVKDSAAVLAKNKELLDANAKIKEEIYRLKKEKEEADKKIKEKEEADLIAKGEYKKLYEQSEEAKKEFEKKDKERSEQLEKGIKLSKVQEELTKLGLNPERLSIVMQLCNITGIKYDNELKICTGADAEAARIKIIMPEMFVKRDTANVDHGHPNGTSGTGKLTMDEYLKMDKKTQQLNYPRLVKDLTGVTVTPRKRF